MGKKILDWIFGETCAEKRIGATAGVILLLLVLITGAAVFSVLSRQLGAQLESSLIGTLNDKERFFHKELDAGMEMAEGVVARRPQLLKLMHGINAGAADEEEIREIGAILENISLKRNVSAIELLDARGKRISAKGEFLHEPAVAAALRHPEKSTLLWKGAFFIQVVAPVLENGALIGTLRMEIPRPDMTGVLQDYTDLGKTGEILICGALPQNRMSCFPSRLSPNGYETQRHPNGAPLPMNKALEGKSGADTTLDYRRQEVFAAYRGLGNSGLGMVIKMDTRELEQPIRERLLWIAPFLAALVTLGVGLLRWQVKPLVHEIASSRERLHAIMDNAADGLITIDEHGIIESFNISVACMFGYSPFEAVGKNVSMLMPESLRSKHNEGMQKYLRTGVARVIGRGAHEVQGQRKDGSFFPMELTLGEMVLGGRRLFIGSVRDTSALKQAHEELESSFNALKTANLGLEETQAQLRQAEQDNDRQMNALADANVRMVLYHASMERVREADSALAKGGEMDVFCRDIVNNAMSLTGARYGALGLFDADGNLARFITEGVDAETRALLGKLPTGKGLLGAFYREGKIVRVDNIAADPRSCGFPPNHPPMKSLIGVPIGTGTTTHGVLYLTDKDNSDPFTDNDEILMDMLGMEIGHILQRYDLLGDLHVTNQTMQTEREEQRVLIVRLEEAQNQLLQSEKMASIGQLAAGVAHEINNPIGYVYSNLGSLDKYIRALLGIVDAYEKTEAAIADGEALSRVRAAKQEADLEFLREDVPALMSESQEGITRVKKIVQDLKDFSHVDEAEWQWVDIRKGIDSTLNIVWSEIKYKAEVVKEYGEMPEVECLSSQLNQVFMNLLVNAAHAIEERGTITLRSGVEGEEAWVEIVDTGKGISPENLTRIFDPFFTTKPVGKGTGLGLSLSYSIMQKHHGRIEVASEVGKGTTFRIWLPIKQPEKKE